MSSLYENISEDIKSGKTLELKPEGRFWVVNGDVMSKSRILGAGGVLLTAYAVKTSVNNIMNSPHPVQQTVKESVIWSSSITGGELGAEIGTWILPGYGTVIGGIVGGIAGTIAVSQEQ